MVRRVVGGQRGGGRQGLGQGNGRSNFRGDIRGLGSWEFNGDSPLALALKAVPFGVEANPRHRRVR